MYFVALSTIATRKCEESFSLSFKLKHSNYDSLNNYEVDCALIDSTEFAFAKYIDIFRKL